MKCEEPGSGARAVSGQLHTALANFLYSLVYRSSLEPQTRVSVQGWLSGGRGKYCSEVCETVHCLPWLSCEKALLALNFHISPVCSPKLYVCVLHLPWEGCIRKLPEVCSCMD